MTTLPFDKVTDVAKFWSIVRKYVPNTADFDYHNSIRRMSRSDQVRIDGHRRRFLAYLLENLSRDCRPFCVFKDAGSKAPTSDIDVTSFYAQPVTLIQMAQHIAEDVYGPGTTLQRLFDMNIYPHTWYILCLPKGVTVYEECPERRKFMTPRILLQQFLWGTLRIIAARRNPMARLIFNILPKRMRHAAILLQQRVRRKARLQGASDAAVARVTNLLNRMPQRLYAYFDANSYLASLQHDAYLTVGAYNHVVLHMQRRLTIRMTEAEYLMSLLDNVGFMCSLLQQGDELSFATPGEKMLKYFYRCIDALINLGFDQPINIHRILHNFYNAKLRGNTLKYRIHMDNVRALFKTNAMIMQFLAEKINIVLTRVDGFQDNM